MRGRLGRLAPAMAVTALALAAVPAAALAATHPVQDPVPIGHNQYFTGLVNGHPPGTAVIAVACVVGATSGHPLAGQTIEVEPAPVVSTNPDLGYTGSKGKSISAALSTSPVAVLIAHFTSYYVKDKISTKLSVPCSGTGTILFTPAPASPTARSASLSVTFGNITAKRA